ncbi:hypothetical protein [Microbacterium album]|uniref:Uncharacterized protein n=1 Tax=Microbacterium album TaxID=2053191 RepID=A0A917IDH7_9MICO|nr:hypothetical protein [Microbacterium album]GGH35145.1 hypothetical protein GCM10010921_03380 [Microbacterium album]
MASLEQNSTTQAPEWFGSAARGIAFFPVMMSAYAVFYAAWWPFAWGYAGSGVFALVVVLAAVFIARGVAQIRHASSFPNNRNDEDQRLGKTMGLLNSVTHPIWMLGSIILLAFGEGRWVLPLMVFVIGAHFVPMARILGRRIDYVLGPVAMVGAIIAGVLALDPQVSWLVVFAVAGIGGAVATLCYAVYMARAYRRLCERAVVPFPLTASVPKPR